MSSSTWTPDALLSNARRLAGKCWRSVEAQNRASTAKLTDNLAEQARLEDLIEASKPRLPAECAHLHFLLSTPFRYGAPYPQGSRFRKSGLTEGVFYGAELPETSIAEIAFHRLLFFADSPATPWPANAGEYSAFGADYATTRGIELWQTPLNRDEAHWMHPVDYGACQSFAATARQAGIEVIGYRSVRDPHRGRNLALLTCRTFTRNEPGEHQTWRIHLGSSGVRAYCEFPRLTLEFDRTTFANDPRIAAMTWDRESARVPTTPPHASTSAVPPAPRPRA